MAQKEPSNFLEERTNRRMVQDLTTYIIVSGLLTTSTYPAVYTPYVPSLPKDPSSDEQIGGSINNNDTLYWWFRAINGVSFVLSVCAIFVAVLTVALLQYFNTYDNSRNESKRDVHSWAEKRVETSYSMSWVLLMLALGSALTGAGIAAFRFDHSAAGGFAFFVVCATIIIGCIWLFIVYPSRKDMAKPEELAEQDRAKAEEEKAKEESTPDKVELQRRKLEKAARQQIIRLEVERREAIECMQAERRNALERMQASRQTPQGIFMDFMERGQLSTAILEQEALELRQAIQRLHDERQQAMHNLLGRDTGELMQHIRRERQKAEREEAERQEIERREAERKEHIRRERQKAEREEADRQEIERREAERKEADRREAERKEADRREAEERAKSMG